MTYIAGWSSRCVAGKVLAMLGKRRGYGSNTTNCMVALIIASASTQPFEAITHLINNSGALALLSQVDTRMGIFNPTLMDQLHSYACFHG